MLFAIALAFVAPAPAFLFRFGDDPHRRVFYTQNLKFAKLLEGPLKRILIVEFYIAATAYRLQKF